MQKFADYIKRIEIDSLWSGKKHIVWNLDPRVNILSGINGQGKSTILNKVVKACRPVVSFPAIRSRASELMWSPRMRAGFATT